MSCETVSGQLRDNTGGGEVLQPWIVARLQKLRNRPAIPVGGTAMLRFVFWHIYLSHYDLRMGPWCCRTSIRICGIF